MLSPEIVKSKLLKGGWWDIRPILGCNCDINICVGQRSNGKTYGVLKHFLQDYKKTQKRFCYVRRWHDDIKASNAQQFLDPLAGEIEKLFGKGYTVYYYRGCYYLINDEGKKLDCIGYVVALSDSHHQKSVPYVNVYNILFDEFIPMSNKERHLDEEKLKWENVLSTVLRTRDNAKIFLVANTVSKFSWVFTAYGFSINKCEQGNIYVKEFPTDAGILRIALEYCLYSEEVGKKSSKYTTSNMIKTGAWQLPETSDIPTTEGERVREQLLFTMQEPDTPDVIIGCYLHNSKWETIETNDIGLKYTVPHVREFLVLHTSDRRSKYHHLTFDKSLDYSTYNDLSIMLKDIDDNCGLDVEKELYMGRIFSDNAFTADYFLHCWNYYGMVAPHALL